MNMPSYKSYLCYYRKVLILNIFLVFSFTISLSAQTGTDNKSDSLVYSLKKSQLKLYFVSHAKAFLKAYKPDNKTPLSLSQWNNIELYYLGYKGLFPEIEVDRPDIKLKPKFNERLYITYFQKNYNNIFLYNWLNKKTSSLFSRKNYLLFLDNSNNWVTFHPSELDYSLPDYFSLDAKKPSSYIDLIKVFVKNSPPGDIVFDRRTQDSLFFIKTLNYVNGEKRFLEYSLSVDSPMNYSIRIPDVIDSTKVYMEEPPLPPFNHIEFKDIEDKKNYLFSALMANVYLYKLNEKAKRLSWAKIDSLDIKDLLPDYDEYLSRLWLLRYGCCWIDQSKKKALYDRLPESIRLIQEVEDDFQIVVGEHRRHRDRIEYYKLYMDTTLILKRAADPQFGGASFNPYPFRYDAFYQPKWEWIEKKGMPPPPPPPLGNYPPARRLSACTMGYNYDTVYNHYDIPYDLIFREVNHYLLALNTRTRDVYFLSGKDIFLTESVPLYLRMVKDFDTGQPKINNTRPDYEQLRTREPILLWYIQDRLYRYLVERLDESNVVFRDEEKMVLRCQGEEYKKPLELEVTFYYDNPEELEVKVLDE
jgi:hypothetical protein